MGGWMGEMGYSILRPGIEHLRSVGNLNDRLTMSHPSETALAPKTNFNIFQYKKAASFLQLGTFAFVVYNNEDFSRGKLA